MECVSGAISDYAGSGFLDEALLALIRTDGTMDPELMTSFVAEHPDRIDALTQFGRDAERATEAAAEAASGRGAHTRIALRRADPRDRARCCRQQDPAAYQKTSVLPSPL